MYYLNAETIRKLDEKTIADGVPGIVLMERAGYGAFQFLSRVAAPDSLRFLVIAGKGNNAGDALVIVRYLLQQGNMVTILALSNPEEYTGDALLNWESLHDLGPDVIVITDSSELKQFCSLWQGDVIIDGLLGTGIRGEVSGLYAEAIECMNNHPARVFSLDIPSGLHCDTGEPCGCAVKADWTATFAHPKRSMLTESGSEYCGRVEVIDIGIDPSKTKEVVDTCEEDTLYACLSASEVHRMLPTRHIKSHKNVFGHLLVIAGSTGMTGAAVLAAHSALKSGAGLVTLAVPESLAGIVAPAVPSIMTLPLPDGGSGTLTSAAIPVLEKQMQKFTAVALGPGIGLSDATHAFVKAFMSICALPIVIDADALNCIASTPGLINTLSEMNVVITPHPGEFARLRGSKPGTSTHSRLESVQSFAEAHTLSVLLKGFQTVIASPTKETYINPTGNAGMATAGSGDVLTGIIGGLLAQGIKQHKAAVAGAYIHGLAGDIAAAEQGQISMTSSDIIQSLGKAFKSVSSQ